MKLHYSQTTAARPSRFASFSTLWNYTTLKLKFWFEIVNVSFSTLWNYTTLKHIIFVFACAIGFSTLWNYTTLKHTKNNCKKDTSFSTLWNYTTLKQTNEYRTDRIVSVPYEITLLSNNVFIQTSLAKFQYLMKLHYSQTITFRHSASFEFQYLMKLHYSQTCRSVLKSINGFSTLWNYTTLKPLEAKSPNN